VNFAKDSSLESASFDVSAIFSLLEGILLLVGLLCQEKTALNARENELSGLVVAFDQAAVINHSSLGSAVSHRCHKSEVVLALHPV
jgi:hypothetical protein